MMPIKVIRHVKESIRDEFSKQFIRFVVLFVGFFCDGGGSGSVI